MTFIDFFAGLGGFTAGLEQAGFRCIGFCEKDKYAVKSYRAIHSPDEKEWFNEDITTLEPGDIPYADGWTAGFPCQDISISGKHQSGLSGERSRLFFEIIRLVKGKAAEDKPRWICLENVKNLLSINGGRDFTEVLYQLSEVGYDAEWQLINSKSYVPQNRERVFIIGRLRGERGGKVFPVGAANTKTPVELIGGCQGNRVYDPSGIAVTLTSVGGGGGARTGLYCVGVNRKDGIIGGIECAHTLNASDYRGLNRNQTQNAVVEYAGENMCFIDLCKKSQLTDTARCLKARYNSGITNHKADNSGVLVRGDFKGRIRKLTPLECFRLQGWSDEQFYRAQAVNSDNQLYKQAGNGVTVPVIYAIGQKLREVYHAEK